MNFSKYYSLENHLFGEVHNNFHENHFLSAEEFFCIVIWKANRAKSKIAKKFHPAERLEEEIKNLTLNIYEASNTKERMRLLLEYRNKPFYLPMASAILSVLYPKDFSVYDYRVCDMLKEKYNSNEYHNFQYRKFESLWTGYLDYLEKVKTISKLDNYREADKFLWGKSFYQQLHIDLKTGFKKNI